MRGSRRRRRCRAGDQWFVRWVAVRRGGRGPLAWADFCLVSPPPVPSSVFLQDRHRRIAEPQHPIPSSTRDHSFACRQVIFYDRPSRDSKKSSSKSTRNRSHSCVFLSSRWAIVPCIFSDFFGEQNEQILNCFCTKDVDPATHKVSLVQGPAADGSTALVSLAVPCTDRNSSDLRESL